MSEAKVLGFPVMYSISVFLSLVLLCAFSFLSLYISCYCGPLNNQQIDFFNTCNDIVKTDFGLLVGLIGGKMAK